MAYSALAFKLLQKNATVIIAVSAGMHLRMNFNNGINSDIYLGFSFTKNREKKVLNITFYTK